MTTSITTRETAEAILNELININSFFRSDKNSDGMCAYKINRFSCCGIREYWGINNFRVENFNPKQIIADIVQLSNNDGYGGCYGSLLFLEPYEYARCEKLVGAFNRFGLGQMTKQTVFRNANTGADIHQYSFQPNWSVINALLGYAPWGRIYKQWSSYYGITNINMINAMTAHKNTLLSAITRNMPVAEAS